MEPIYWRPYALSGHQLWACSKCRALVLDEGQWFHEEEHRRIEAILGIVTAPLTLATEMRVRKEGD